MKNTCSLNPHLDWLFIFVVVLWYGIFPVVVRL